MIHEPNTIQIATTKPPILLGCKSEGLWTVKVNSKEQTELRQEVNYVLKELVHQLQAAAGFPVQEWIDAIKAGNYTTWPGINVKTVNRYFPESEETQKRPYKKATTTC